MSVKLYTVSGVIMLDWVENDIREKEPGNYRVVAVQKANKVYEYWLEFDDPAEETFWRLKYE